MHSLPLFLKIAGEPVILLGTDEAAQARRRLIERAGGVPVGEEDGRACIAFIAIEDTLAAAAAARLKARGLLVNVADRPELCDFTMPAIVDRDPVLVAVSTGGASAGLAAALRQRLEDLLPAHLGKLAMDLRESREEIREEWPDPAERRRAIARALAPGGQIDPLGVDPDVTFWLMDRPDTTCSETLVIRPRSSDPDDLTVREARSLGFADRIVHDGRAPEAILARARADAVRLVMSPGYPAPEAPGLTVIIEISVM